MFPQSCDTSVGTLESLDEAAWVKPLTVRFSFKAERGTSTVGAV
jgi:hypothetical protein